MLRDWLGLVSVMGSSNVSNSPAIHALGPEHLAVSSLGCISMSTNRRISMITVTAATADGRVADSVHCHPRAVFPSVKV
jgi:hypothetical protein